jgi:hypothetical protein
LEPALSIGVLLFASAVATNALPVPAALAGTPSGVVLVVVALLASVVAPTLSVAILVLAVVLFYNRNIQQTVKGTLQQFEAERAYPETSPTYGDQRFPTQPPAMQGADGIRSGPGTYGQSFGSIEGFTSIGGATVSQSMELDPPKGQFPTQEPRETASPVTDQYTYRPSEDTGSNAFQRFGPQMDQKVDSFRYYN